MPAGSSPLAGSSRISSAGSFRSAAASPSRCFMPSEYVRNGSSPAPPRPTRSSTSSTRRRGRCGRCRASSSRFRRPEKFGKNCGVSTIEPTRRDRPSRARRRRRAPSSRARPPRRRARGRAGTGSSSSCPSRWDRGTRTRRPRARSGRARATRDRAAPPSAGTPCAAPRPRSRPPVREPTAATGNGSSPSATSYRGAVPADIDVARRRAPARPASPPASRPAGGARRARGRQGHVPARQDLRRRADDRRAPAARAARARRPLPSPAYTTVRETVLVGADGRQVSLPLPAAASTPASCPASSSTPRSSTSPATRGVEVREGAGVDGDRSCGRSRRGRASTAASGCGPVRRRRRRALLRRAALLAPDAARPRHVARVPPVLHRRRTTAGCGCCSRRTCCPGTRGCSRSPDGRANVGFGVLRGPGTHAGRRSPRCGATCSSGRACEPCSVPTRRPEEPRRAWPIPAALDPDLLAHGPRAVRGRRRRRGRPADRRGHRPGDRDRHARGRRDRRRRAAAPVRVAAAYREAVRRRARSRPAVRGRAPARARLARAAPGSRCGRPGSPRGRGATSPAGCSRTIPAPSS